MMHLFSMCLLSLLLWGAPAAAKEAVPTAEDPAVEARLMALAEELRCLVCQNQTLAASEAELAQDLRREIREMIQAGRSDKEITDYLVERYGDFVLYRPPFKATTVLLWLGPALLVGIGGTVLVTSLRRQRAQVPMEAPLSAEERRRLSKLLKDEDGKKG